jgi:hypothetical protein
MRIRPLEPYRQSLNTLLYSSGCHYMLRPAGVGPFGVTWRGLPPPG